MNCLSDSTVNTLFTVNQTWIIPFQELFQPNPAVLPWVQVWVPVPRVDVLYTGCLLSADWSLNSHVSLAHHFSVTGLNHQKTWVSGSYIPLISLSPKHLGLHHYRLGDEGRVSLCSLTSKWIGLCVAQSPPASSLSWTCAARESPVLGHQTLLCSLPGNCHGCQVQPWIFPPKCGPAVPKTPVCTGRRDWLPAGPWWVSQRGKVLTRNLYLGSSEQSYHYASTYNRDRDQLPVTKGNCIVLKSIVINAKYNSQVVKDAAAGSLQGFLDKPLKPSMPSKLKSWGCFCHVFEGFSNSKWIVNLTLL